MVVVDDGSMCQIMYMDMKVVVVLITYLIYTDKLGGIDSCEAVQNHIYV